MLIVLTGAAGIGKTTICQKTVELVRSSGCSCGGVISYRGPEGTRDVQDLRTGHTLPLASRVEGCSGPRVGPYFFDSRAIEFGVDAIDRARGSDVLVVDEIGFLEVRGQGFRNAIRAAQSESPPARIVVVRRELLSALVPLILPSWILEATTSNRALLPGLVAVAAISAATAFSRPPQDRAARR